MMTCEKKKNRIYASYIHVIDIKCYEFFFGIHRIPKSNAFVTSSITRFHSARRCGPSFSFSGISFKNNSPTWARIYN